MYNLDDLKGLIFQQIYEKLDEAVGDGKRYHEIADDVEEIIHQYTNYTSELLSEDAHSDAKNKLRRLFGWVLEYFSLTYITSITDTQSVRIHANYNRAIKELSAFPKYYDASKSTAKTGIVNIDGVVEW